MDERRLVVAGVAAMAAGNLGLATGNYLFGDVVTATGMAGVGLVLALVAHRATVDDSVLDLSELPLGRRGRRLVAAAVLAAGLVVLLAGVVVAWVALA